MNKYVKYGLSIVFAGVLLWLSFSSVSFSELTEAMQGMRWTWVFPFTLILIFSHYIRAERWRLLIHDARQQPLRSTLFAGVMFGYLINIPFPRLGEISRPMYVAKQIEESNSKMIGTIVLERLIDVLSMLIIMAFVAYFLVSDVSLLNRLFGVDITDPEVYRKLISSVVPILGIGLLMVILMGYVLYRWSKTSNIPPKWDAMIQGFVGILKQFAQGLISIRKLENAPLFILYTLLIWAGYIAMMYVPFFMFDLPANYGLDWSSAAILTMASAVALSIPTPGGMGSYHYFISYSLGVLFAIPEATGLAFATITHTATLVLVILITPLALAFDKYWIMKHQGHAQKP